MRTLLTLFLIVVSLHSATVPPPLVSSKKAAAAGGGNSFSDDFNRANNDSLGANWTEITGDIDIDSNTFFKLGAADFSTHDAIWNTATTTVEQYSKSVFVTGAFTRPHYLFRYVDTSSAFYEIEVDILNGFGNWNHWTAVGGTKTQIQQIPLTPSSGDVLAWTISGTGNSTVIRCWINPTGDAPDSAISWGGDTTPDGMWDTNPASPCDTGTKVGLGFLSSADASHDNFFGGTIP